MRPTVARFVGVRKTMSESEPVKTLVPDQFIELPSQLQTAQSGPYLISLVS